MVARFALTSLAVFMLIGIAITVYRAHDVREREERAAVVRAEFVAHAVVRPLLQPDDLASPIAGDRYDQIDQALGWVFRSDAGVERIKIWGTDGTVLFSDDPGQVGFRPPMGEDLRLALRGEPQSDVSTLDAPENVRDRNLADRLFETYVPLR